MDVQFLSAFYFGYIMLRKPVKWLFYQSLGAYFAAVNFAKHLYKLLYVTDINMLIAFHTLNLMSVFTKSLIFLTYGIITHKTDHEFSVDGYYSGTGGGRNIGY